MTQMEREATTADRLREAMEEKNMKQIDLARATGIAHSTISRYLSGAVEPRQYAMIMLADALGVSEWWLYGYKVSKDRTQGMKKSDQRSKLVGRLNRDPLFEEAVSLLDKLSPEELNSVLMLLRPLVDK